MSKSAHTPLPWFYQENSDEYTHIIRPKDTPGSIIVHMRQDTSGLTEANARLIVTAVNHHQELVTRLQDMVDEFDEEYTEGSHRYILIQSARETLKQLES